MTNASTRSAHIADDGDELKFCSTCVFSSVCMDEGLAKSDLRELHMLIEHVGPYHAGDHLFRLNEPFTAIMAVRAGTVKTYVIDDDGREQVLGIYLPGELIGLAAIDADRYPCHAVALDTVTVCRYSFPAMATLATRLPGLQLKLFRLLSREVMDAWVLSSDQSADARMAAFLLSLSQRHAARGCSADHFLLSMSRSDIANYLRMAPETISRVLKRMRDEGILSVDGRDVRLLDRSRLENLTRNMLR